MLFKDLKQGNPIYIFNRNNGLVKEGKVSSVGLPHTKAQMSFATFINISVNIDNEILNYEVKDTAESAYVDNLMLTPNTSTIVTEARIIKQQSQEILDSIDNHEKIKNNCEQVLMQYDKTYKEQKNNEERLRKLEQSVDYIQKTVTELSTYIKQTK